MAIIVKNAASVIDKGVVTTEWNGRKREVPKVVIRWALDVEREDGQPFFVDQWYTASLSQKATLRQHLETWRGRAFTPDELAGFDLEALIGVNCHLVVIHNYKDERTFANVKGITPLGKSAVKMNNPTGYMRVRDRPRENGGPESHPGRPWKEEDPDGDLPF